MIAAVATLDIVLGLVCFRYGTMSAIERRRNRRELGLSRFGLAWLAMAFPAGASPRPRDRRLAEGRYAGGLDLVATAIAFPAGVTWFLLRVEAFRGGRGDRFIHGSPWWVLALPTAFAVYVTVVVMTIIDAGGIGAAGLPMALPNLVLVAIYAMVGFYVTRTQLFNRRPLGGWSLSGLSLAVIVPTCAVMHGVFAAARCVGTSRSTPITSSWIGCRCRPGCTSRTSCARCIAAARPTGTACARRGPARRRRPRSWSRMPRGRRDQPPRAAGS